MDERHSSTDTVEFWNEIWETMEHTFADYDEALADAVQELVPGRALDMGCGAGGNAMWLAARGWQVTAVDFSDVAIQKARQRATERGVEVNFVVADAAAFQPQDEYDLITTFYIHLWPRQRAQMLSNVSKALAPGGRLLFVSHDKAAPPSGWSEEDLESLTTPEEIVAELPGLHIERAEVVHESGAHMEHMPQPEEEDAHHSEASGHEHADGEYHPSATTIVVAVR